VIRFWLAQLDNRQEFGGYWKQRAEAVLVSRSGASVGGGMVKEVRTSLELLRTEASQLISAERIDEAIDRLRQAVEIAEENKLSEEAFDFGLKIAAVLNKQGDKQNAAEQFAACALAHPDQAKSSASHLMAVWLDSERLKRKTDIDNVDLEKLHARLYAQLKQWPEDENASTARIWLDHSLLASGMLSEAAQIWVDSVATADDKDSRIEMAVSRVLLLAMKARAESPLAPRVELAALLDQRLSELYSKSSGVKRSRLAVALATLREFARDDRWLSVDRGYLLYETKSDMRVELNVVEVNPFSKTFDSALRLMKAARSGESPLADHVAVVCESIDASEGQRAIYLYPLLDSLFCVVADLPKTLRDAWGNVLVQIVSQLESAQLGGTSGDILTTRKRIIIASVEVWQSTGNFNKPFEGLDVSNPKNPAVIAAKAFALRDHDPIASVKMLQRLAAGVSAGSPWWFEARLRTALIYGSPVANGPFKKDQARQILDVVMATYPEADPQWLKRCAQIVPK